MLGTYNPSEIEPKWYQTWLTEKAFHVTPSSDKEPYCIVIPPPNVTGMLTMGHVLNNTIQDILIRYHRMKGRQAMWMPGTDHAGIATQNVVEKKLAKEGINRHDLGREKFLEHVWAWKEQYGGTIIRQLKQLGCACDWDRERFTMDDGLSRAVREVFVRLHEKGLIYKGKYIVNWCPRCRTALSDEENEHQEENGHLWHIKYPVKGEKTFVTVATTRPETMLGDTAVAVNPKDHRYKKLIGKTVILPLLGRDIPIISDSFVDTGFGTGCVKVTPAHDPNDFEIGLRHDLPRITVMDEDGRMNTAAGPYEGMDRFACRTTLINDLKQKGLIDKVTEHVHAVGHCQRCNTVVEPYLSSQWFVKMKPLARPAIQAVLSGRLRFFPDKWTGVYMHWMENIRDWCISRQLWWGHRVPVYTCACGETIVSADTPNACPLCGKTEWTQDPDVLDTWFSSWLWPFSTLNWPDDTADLKYFYPTHDLVTGPDIIFFWVARMVMAGYEFTGDCPFERVYFTSMVRDMQGRKMSKSLGNSPDPTAVINTCGADALRFIIMFLAPMGQDIHFSAEKTEQGKNFANKIWNAAKFVMMNTEGISIDGFDPATEKDLFNAWIIGEYVKTLQTVDRALTDMRFNEAVTALYHFLWHEFCDWYIEVIKPALGGQSGEGPRQAAQKTLLYILTETMKLLHPVMPFITEDMFRNLGHNELLLSKQWPSAPSLSPDNGEVAARMTLIKDTAHSIRNIRGEMNITPDKKLNVTAVAENTAAQQILENHTAVLCKLAGLASIAFGREKVPGKAASAVITGAEIYVDLIGAIDFEKEQERLKKTIEKLGEELSKKQKKLSSHAFTVKAPPDVVENVRQQAALISGKIEKMKENLARIL